MRARQGHDQARRSERGKLGQRAHAGPAHHNRGGGQEVRHLFDEELDCAIPV